MERKTKIIATLGPASHSEEVFSKMAPYVDMVRLNFSWGTYEDMEFLINLVRKVCAETGKEISIIQDLSGPRVQDNEGHHFSESISEVITNKDREDLAFGLKNGVDYVALSYVGESGDILKMREEMEKIGVNIKIISKIERKEAVDNLEAIIDVSDAVMIARGDLGQAFPFEEVPFIEQRILSACKKKNKFVIVATEMLLSMVHAGRPTRAEVTDVAFAVLGNTSAVMLSEETAQGDHPALVVEVLDRIVRNAEAHRNS